jgi:5-methylcytosine-specific restriction protein A
MAKHCAQPGCRAIVTRGRCAAHRRSERDRPNVDIRKWYRSPRWRALRAWKLKQQPHCGGREDGIPCGAQTTDIDHIIPHRGNSAMFWSVGNLEAKCHRCHSSKTGRGL